MFIRVCVCKFGLYVQNPLPTFLFIVVRAGLLFVIPPYGISSVNSIIDYLLSGSFHLAVVSPWILPLKHFLRQLWFVY